MLKITPEKIPNWGSSGRHISEFGSVNGRTLTRPTNTYISPKNPGSPYEGSLILGSPDLILIY